MREPLQVYVAAPSSWAVATNPLGKRVMSEQLLATLLLVTKHRQEWALVSPMFYHAWLYLDPTIACDYKTWVGVCETMLLKSDMLLVLDAPGWEESVGVTAEIKFADERGIPWLKMSDLSSQILRETLAGGDPDGPLVTPVPTSLLQ